MILGLAGMLAVWSVAAAAHFFGHCRFNNSGPVPRAFYDMRRPLSLPPLPPVWWLYLGFFFYQGTLQPNRQENFGVFIGKFNLIFGLPVTLGAI